MQTLKSRSRFHSEHTTALIIFFFGIGGSIKLAVDPYDKHGQSIEGIFGFFMLFIWLVFGFSIYLILKVPKIVISDKSIVFKTIFSSRNISWAEIEAINLTGKRSSFLRNDEEVSTLVLKNGEKIFIRIEYYKNSPEIRQLLNEIKNLLSANKNIHFNLVIPKPVYKPQRVTPLEKNFVKYAGTSYLNFNAILWYGITIGLIIGTHSIIKQHPERLAIILIPIIVFYLAFGFLLHYFLVSDKFIIIKNAFWFWKRHVYHIDELEEIVFEEYRKGKMSSNALRIITKDFKTKCYPAAGLWSKNWNELKNHFHSLGVTVRNHLSF